MKRKILELKKAFNNLLAGAIPIEHSEILKGSYFGRFEVYGHNINEIKELLKGLENEK